jgi:hypothetical protein
VNGEWVRVRNTHPTRTVSLEGWWLRDASLHLYDFPAQFTFPGGAVLGPGASLVVHVGAGADTATDLYWGETDPIFENVKGGTSHSGDGAYLFDPDGDLRAYAQYPCEIGCDEPLLWKVVIGVHPTAPESITVANISAETVNLYEYEIENVPYFYEFRPTAFLQPGAATTVYVGASSRLDAPFVKGWGLPSFILDNESDVVTLRNPIGAPFACVAWGGDSCPSV